MSDPLTHSRGETSVLNPITGEAPGIKEILERRTSGEELPPAEKPDTQTTDTDDATRAAAEISQWRQRATEADNRLQESERARVAAEQRAATAVQGAEDTGFTAITTALASAQQETESLRAETKAAGEAGDFSRVAEIAVRLGQLGAQINDLERGKGEFERAREARLTRPAPERPAPQATSATERAILGRLGAQSRDQFLASRTPATAAFLRETPEFFTDESAFARISGADSLAAGRGIQKDTPEYFDLIKREAGLSQSSSPPTPRQTERAVTPGAAPTRTAPSPSGRAVARSGDVYVSPEQRTAAEWMGVDPVEYAREEEALRNRGDLPYRRR